MNKENTAKNIGYLYFAKYKYLIETKYDNYVIDKEKLKKLKKIEKYCKKLISKCNAEIDGYYIKKDMPSAIEIRFKDDLTFGYETDDIVELTEILTLCDGVTISNAGNSEDFMIAFFVKDLFIPKV